MQTKINTVYGQNHDFGKYNGFMEKTVEFVMTTMSHDGSETTSQLQLWDIPFSTTHDKKRVV